MYSSLLFDDYPVSATQIHSVADATRGRLALLRELQSTIGQTHRALLTAVEGDLRASVQDAPTQVLSNASAVEQHAHYAAGCLDEFGHAVDRYNESSDDPRSISRLNAAYQQATLSNFGAVFPTARADAAAAQTHEAVESYQRQRDGAEAALLHSLAAEKTRLDSALDGSAAEVKAMLERGPNAADVLTLFRSGSLPLLAPVIFADVHFSPWDMAQAWRARSAVSSATESDDLRVMTLNVGGGHGNKPWDSDGMDPGDVDELAQRIINQDVNIATLQEVWGMDLGEIQESLNRLDPEGNWDIEFQSASTKPRSDDDWAGTIHLDQPFGNAIAVRQGDGQLSYTRVDLGDDAKLDEPGDDGSDGRSMIMVAVTTCSGATVNVSTAHLDYGGVSPAAQAAQVADLRQTTEQYGRGDPAVITGDLNHAITDQNLSGDALRDYVDAGYADAGEDVGPTSDYGHGRRIDYVFTGPGLTAGAADRVQGDSPDAEGEDEDLSDHDGIVVQVEVPVPVDSDSPGGVGSGGGGGGSGSW